VFFARLRVRAAEELIETGRRAASEDQATKALGFYLRVGATYYVDRGEALLSQDRLNAMLRRRCLTLCVCPQ